MDSTPSGRSARRSGLLQPAAWGPGAGVLLAHLVLWQFVPGTQALGWLDRLTHLLGGAAAAWWLIRGCGWNRRALLGGVAGIALLWEFLEWALAAGGVIGGGLRPGEAALDVGVGVAGAVLLLRAAPTGRVRRRE